MNQLPSPEDPPSSRFPQKLLQALGRLFFWIPSKRKDLVDFLQKATRKGLLDNESLAMIEGVFDVGDMRVRDIMIPRSQMTVVSKDATFDEVQTIVADSAHSRFPVVGDDSNSIEGVLLAKDLLRYFNDNDKEDFRVKDLLRRPNVVPESKRLIFLLEEFRRSRNHMAIVVDEYGGAAGLVTIEDVLEQIVGDIADEHDIAEDEYIYDYKDGRHLVKALMPLDDFNEYFKSRLSNGNADTIGGLIIGAFGYLPKRRETVTIEGFTFEINRADTRRVHSLWVSAGESARREV